LRGNGAERATPFKEGNCKEEKTMKSNNNAVVPEAREALDKFKMEAASDLGVPTTC